MIKSRKINGGQNIKVYVRVRPLLEEQRGSRVSIECPDHCRVDVSERHNTKKQFTFDHAFGPGASQDEIFKVVARPLVKEVLNGFSCTIFAYGQTSSGKTHTMEGNLSESDLSSKRADEKNQEGIIPRCIRQLFDELAEKQVEEFSVKVSFLELYNEELYDLLSSHEDFTKLRLYESALQKGTCHIQGLEEIVVRNKQEVLRILQKGSAKRQTAATNMNDQSSRSHTVFTITVQIKENTEDGDELMKIGKLHLVDLAGSENIGRSGAVDKRAREAGNINVSLLTLGKVITRLRERTPHIPYRESKLTRLLQDALGGRSKTSIIATVSPLQINVEETLSTLHYANHAKDIKNCPEVNKKVTKREILVDYTNEIYQLKQALFSQREKDGVHLSLEQYEEMEYQNKIQSEEILEKIAQLRANEEEIEKLKDDFSSLEGKLCEKEEKLAQTESTLKSTGEVLQVTQKCLTETAFEKDEQAYLVAAHVSTEEKLHHQGQNLINVAITTTSDIEQLQNKIDTKRTVESTNEQIGFDFTQEVEDHVSSFKNNLAESMSNYQQSSRKLSDNLCKMEASNSELTSISQDLKDISSIPSQILYDLKDVCSSHVAPAIKELKCNNDKCTQRCNNEFEALEAQNMKLNGLTRGLVQLISALSGNASQSHLIKDKISTVMDICNSTSRFSLNNLVDLSSKISEIHEKFLEVEEQNRLKNTENLNQKLLGIRSLCDEIEQEHSSLTSSQACHYKDTVNAVTDLTKKINLSVEETLSEKSKQMLEGAHIAAKAKDLLISNFEEIEGQIKGLESSCSSLESEISSHYTRCSEAFNQLNGMTTATQKAQEKRAKDFEAAVSDIVQTESNRFSSTSQKQISRLNDEITNLQCEIEAMELGLSLQSKSLEADNSDHEGRLEALNECAKSLFSEKMSKDVPTGLTPARKEYVFLQSLAKTSPHDIVKQRFRSIATSKIPVLESLDSKDESLTQHDFVNQHSDCFLMPALPRKNSNEARSAPLSRSSSASSIMEMKENLSLDPVKLSSSLKKYIKPPSDNNNVTSRSNRARKVLGNYN